MASHHSHVNSQSFKAIFEWLYVSFCWPKETASCHVHKDDLTRAAVVWDPACLCFTLFCLQGRSLCNIARRFWLVSWPLTKVGTHLHPWGRESLWRVHEARAESFIWQACQTALGHQFGTSGARTHTQILCVNNLGHFQNKPREEIEVWYHLTPALGSALHVQLPQKTPHFTINLREVKGPHLIIVHPTGPSLWLLILHSPVLRPCKYRKPHYKSS